MPTVRFFIDAIFLGVALSMDAFSISVANGLCNQNMSRSQAILIPSTFAFFSVVDAACRLDLRKNGGQCF